MARSRVRVDPTPKVRKLEIDPASSDRMGRVRQRDTEAELATRKLAYSVGLRYRTCNRDLPGTPDLANRTRRWVVFVHGCFWHRHEGCRRATTPKRNREFWLAKFDANVERDARAISALEAAGYTVEVIWECELVQAREEVLNRLKRLRSQG